VICEPPPAPPAEEDDLPPYAALDTVRITAGDLNDQIESRRLQLTADAGSGDDVLRGSDLSDVLDGGEGRDRLTGPGRLVDSDAASIDELEGGIADFARQPAPLTVDLTTLSSTTGDVLRALTGVIGGTAGDSLFGSEQRDQISGRAGDDRMFGRGGNDLLIGGAGEDIVRGDAGDDLVRGAAGADRLSGGSGDDALSGSVGPDRLSGGPGADRLRGGGGLDRYICGPGPDVVIGAHAAELVPPTCETLAYEYGERSIQVTPHPVATGGGRLVFRTECPQGLGTTWPGHGVLTVRSGAGRRLLARGALTGFGRYNSECGARSLHAVAPLTALGLARTRDGRTVDAVVSIRGFNLPRASWRIPLRVSG
jgi:hypothetical protein